MRRSVKKIFKSVGAVLAATVVLFLAIQVGLPVAISGEKAEKAAAPAAPGSAATAAAAPDSASSFVTVEAKVAVGDGEAVIDARERALAAVRDEAILKAAGEAVSPAILLKERARLFRAFGPQREALVEETKILAEEERPDRTFWVRITAKVNSALLEELLMKNLHNDQVVVVTLEKNLKQTLKRHILEHDLIERIKQKGYGIVDYRTIKNPKVDALVSAVRQGSTEAVRKLGRYYMTDLVVVGFVETKFSEKTQEIYSSRCTGQVKVHRIGTRKELASLTRHDVKGFGSDEEKSGIDAIRKVSKDMADEALKGLPANPARQVKVSLKEIDHQAAYQKAKAFLASLPAVVGTRDGAQDFRNEEATLYLRTTRGTDELLRQIAELKKFVVTKVEGGRIWLEARKMN